MKDFTNYIKNKMLPQDGPTRESLFNIAVASSVITCLFNVVFVYSFDYNLSAKIINPVVFVLVLIIFLISDHFKIQKLGSILIVTSVNFIIFPYCFLIFGAVNGGMSSYFILGIVFTVLLVDGIAMYFMVPIEIIFYAIVYVFAKHYPQKIIPLESVTVVYRTSFAYMAVAAILISAVVKTFLTEYRKESKRVKTLLGRLQDLSIKDPLTDVYNRRYLFEFLEQKMSQVKNDSSLLSIIMFDIDSFKQINDTYGHIIGDEVLKKICKVFLEYCKKEDVVARYGGEEFLIILPSTDIKNAQKLAEQIRIAVSENVQIDNLNEKVTISGGVVQYQNNYDIVEFIKRADEKLYIAKTNGRNQIETQKIE